MGKVSYELQYQRDWHQKQREEDYEGYRAKMRENKKRWIRENPEKYLWGIAKERAKKYGREFTIEPTDIEIPEFCPVLGEPLDEVKSGGTYVPSLHRIDSNLGYTPENTMVISSRANMLLNNGLLEEFQKIVSFLEE